MFAPRAAQALEPVVEQLDERAACRRREADGDERGRGPAVVEPVLLERELPRRVEHEDPAGETRSGAGIGLDGRAAARLIRDERMAGAVPGAHRLEGLELSPDAFRLRVDPRASADGEGQKFASPYGYM